MRYQAYEDRKRREELQIIGLRNEIRSLFGEDTIDPYGYSKPRQTAANNEDGLDAFKYRMEKEWDEINIEEDLTKKDVI